MTVSLKYLRSTVQFKNRLVPRGIIAGAPTLLLFFLLGQNRFPEKHRLNRDHVRNIGLGSLSWLVGYLVGRASIHQPLGMWKSLLCDVCTHNSWIQHLPRLVTEKLPPNSSSRSGPGASKLETSSTSLPSVSGWLGKAHFSRFLARAYNLLLPAKPNGKIMHQSKRCYIYQIGQSRSSTHFCGVFPWRFTKIGWQVVTEPCLNSWITRTEGSILWLLDLQT